MNRINLVVSHVLIAAVGVGIGYGLSLMIRPDALRTPQPNQGQTTLADKSTQSPLNSPDVPSSQPGQLDQTKQIASLQDQLSETKEDLEVAEEMLSGDLEESGSTRTPEEKLAAYRKLSQDPDVQRAMMQENRKFIDDPDMQQARRAQREMSAKYSFGELFSKLDLADDQRNEFIQLWVDGQMAEMDARMESQMRLSTDEPGQEEQDTVQARIAAVREQAQERIRDFLGADFEEYDEYAKTMNERSMLNKLSSTATEPLDDYTREALLRIFSEEKAATGAGEPTIGIDLATSLQSQKDALATARIQNAKVIERATSYLTEGQHAGLVEYLTTMQTQIEANIKLLQAHLEAQPGKEDEGE